MRRTTIFLSDELHEQLRHDAFRAKTSMAEIIRQKLQAKPTAAAQDRTRKRRASTDPILKVAGICSGTIMSDGIDELLYGS